MITIYIIYLLTFLVFPFIGYFVSRYFDIKRNKMYFMMAIIIFLFHNMLFYYDISIIGDYPDYVVFSLEYFFLCLITILLYSLKSVFYIVLRIIGSIVLIIGFLQGLIGIFAFIIFCQDLESDKTYFLDCNNIHYQVRRYSFGFATLVDTRYTFETYRRYIYTPFEKKINVTDLFSIKSELDFSDKNFRVNIRDSNNIRIIEFSSTNGKKYIKAID